MKSKIILIILMLVVLVLVGAIIVFYKSEKTAMDAIQTFDQCIENGFPLRQSQPRQCETPDGRVFVETLQTPVAQPTHELISVSAPRAGEEITSPLTVSGQARGPWYFEASFPVQLYDSKNNQIATGIAQAQGDWMTEDFVSFIATVEFQNSVRQNGTLVLRKDNPSGLPEHEDELAIPVVIGITNQN